jgi:acyl carrier protein
MSMRSISVDDVAEVIRAQIGDKLPAHVPLGAETMLEDLGLSSLDLTEVFVSIEELVERELDSVRASNAKTIADLVALVHQQLADAEPSTTR